MVFAILLLAAFVSLGVDFAHVQLVKTELSAAADAGARYGCTALSNSTLAASRATTAAGENTADGSPVVLAAGDVQVGRWDRVGRTFDPAGSPTNAVRVAAARTAARGTPVKLAWAALIGKSTLDVTATSIAALDDPPSPYGIVGIDWFAAQGVLLVDSYPSGNRAVVASNGNVSLNLLGIIGITYVNGDVHPGMAGTIVKPALSFLTSISGSTTSLTAPLYFPPVVVGTTATRNDNAKLPVSIFNGLDLTGVLSTTVPGGTYVVHDFTLLANVNLRFQGATTIYVTGNTTILGSLLVPNSDPANLRVWVAGSGPVNLVANVATFMDLYAPQSAVQITAGLGFYGRIVGKTLDVLGTSIIHYDEALSAAGPAAQVRIVR